LYKRVTDAIYSIPIYFSTETNISGIMVADIFTLNTALSATIEDQVVATLNRMREIWDPDNKYPQYSFIRRSQSFPDVVFASNTPSDEEKIIMGIELKGWYVLAKEGEPSFRYAVTPSACSPQDLVVVVPWVLSNVVTGSPKIYRPYVELAKYAAEYRNYHWKYKRTAKSGTEIVSPAGVTPYPPPKTLSSDKPVSDSGGNFGRFARTGIMDDYIKELLEERMLGIEARNWLTFIKIFAEQKSKEDIERELHLLKEKIPPTNPENEAAIKDIKAIIRTVERYIDTL
jgi:hypothetical protein